MLIDTAVTWGFGIIDENLLYVGSLVHVLFIGRFLDLMWRAVSFQVLPTIVLRNVGTVEAIKTCKKTLRSMLSRNVLAQLGLRIFILVLVLPGVGMLFAAAAAGHGCYRACSGWPAGYGSRPRSSMAQPSAGFIKQCCTEARRRQTTPSYALFR